MTENTQSADIGERIVQLVEECWQEHQMPLLLSRLGTQDDGRIAEVVRQQAGGLADYLRTSLSDRVRVVQHSTKSMVIGAIPRHAAATLDGAYDAILEKTFSRTESSYLRFLPAFWTAFRKPLAEGSRRYVSLREPIHFLDTSSTPQLEEYAEIQRRCIVGFDADTAEVLQSLEKWLTSNDLDIAHFVSTRKMEKNRPPSNDLLDRLLRALGPDDLKRISMPLDVVAKLRREPL